MARRSLRLGKVSSTIWRAVRCAKSKSEMAGFNLDGSQSRFLRRRVERRRDDDTKRLNLDSQRRVFRGESYADKANTRFATVSYTCAARRGEPVWIVMLRINSRVGRHDHIGLMRHVTRTEGIFGGTGCRK